MMQKIKHLLQKENAKNMLIIFIVSIFVCLPLLNNNIDISYDDGVQHIARLMGTFQSLEEGQSFPVIMSNFCNGFGYSWNLFYSPITAYVPLLFKILGMSFIACIKLFMFVMVFLSGITMYFFTKEVTKNKKIALLASIFYIFAPYRFTDMYIRNALAELTSFVFLPMVFHGLYGLLKEKKNREYTLIIGAVGLVLTHTVIAMYVAILCLIYTLTQFAKLKNRKIRNKLIFSLILIIIITSFFWAPLLEHRFSAEYEVFKPGRMERTDVLIAFKLNLSDLLVTPKENMMVFEIGWLSLILLLASPYAIKKLKRKCKNTDFYRFYMFSLIAGLILIIMTLKIFPFEHLPSILKMLQFSFRLLEFTSFFFAFVVAVNFSIIIKYINKILSKRNNKISKQLNRNDILLVICILMVLTLIYTPHLHYADKLDENILWPAVPVTSQTGRVHAGCATFEYLPSKAFENRSYIETRTDDVIVLEGNATIEDKEKQGTNLICKISSEEEALIELPYIYYLGYNVVIEQGGETTKLDTYETDNGFVGAKLPVTQNGILKVSYDGTILMKISLIVSILGVFIVIMRAFLIKPKRK